MGSKWVSELKGFENFKGYKIHDTGEIFSYFAYERGGVKGIKSVYIADRPTRKMKPTKTKKGYLSIALTSRNKKRKTIMVHRLVSLAFIPNPENKPQINHIDCDKMNNHVSNLEWSTNGENQIHAFKNGLNKPHTRELNYQWSGDHKNCKAVRQLDLKGNEIAVHKSLALAGRSLGKSYSGISNVCQGISKTAHGYKWEYVK